MDTTINYYLARARIAEFHDQAERDSLIRAARRERRSARRPAPTRPALGRRVLTALGVRAA